MEAGIHSPHEQNLFRIKLLKGAEKNAYNQTKLETNVQLISKKQKTRRNKY